MKICASTVFVWRLLNSSEKKKYMNVLVLTMLSDNTVYCVILCYNFTLYYGNVIFSLVFVVTKIYPK